MYTHIYIYIYIYVHTYEYIPYTCTVLPGAAQPPRGERGYLNAWNLSISSNNNTIVIIQLILTSWSYISMHTMFELLRQEGLPERVDVPGEVASLLLYIYIYIQLSLLLLLSLSLGIFYIHTQYIYIYICMYVCMYIYIYIDMYLSLSLYIYIYMYHT